MKRVSVLLAAAMVTLLGNASFARATTLTDTFDPTDVLFGKQSESVCTGDNATDSVTGADATNGCFSLVYSILLTGYTDPPDSLVSATLDLYLYDDGDPGHNPETVRITLNDDLEGQFSIANSPFNFDVVAQITPEGTLEVLLERGTQGQGQADFYFDKGVLNAEWDDGTDVDEVPEPATFLLTGAGLGAAAYRRRKTQQTTARSNN
jgi:hypothetical protein